MIFIIINNFIAFAFKHGAPVLEKITYVVLISSSFTNSIKKSSEK